MNSSVETWNGRGSLPNTIIETSTEKMQKTAYHHGTGTLSRAIVLPTPPRVRSVTHRRICIFSVSVFSLEAVVFQAVQKLSLRSA